MTKSTLVSFFFPSSGEDLAYWSNSSHLVKRHSQFFRCARELGETYSSPSQQVVYYLVTDSAHLKSDARSVLGAKLVTTDMVPQHVHQKSGHVDGVFSAVVEDWILAKTDMMVATQVSSATSLISFFIRHWWGKSAVDLTGFRFRKRDLSFFCLLRKVTDFVSFSQ